ncbi:hypothetical protein PM082_024745 [Marasmius tenuissimus]|nr:hypothetical protein PM082_024745 [Marasmius tenuissimus]
MPMGSTFHNLRGDAGHACVLQKDVRAVAVPIMNVNLHVPISANSSPDSPEEITTTGIRGVLSNPIPSGSVRGCIEDYWTPYPAGHSHSAD